MRILISHMVQSIVDVPDDDTLSSERQLAVVKEQCHADMLGLVDVGDPSFEVTTSAFAITEQGVDTSASVKADDFPEV